MPMPEAAFFDRACVAEREILLLRGGAKANAAAQYCHWQYCHLPITQKKHARSGYLNVIRAFETVAQQHDIARGAVR